MYDGQLIEGLTTLVDRVTTHNYVLRDLAETEPYDAQKPVRMTERDALNKNSELRRVGSTLRWKVR